LSAADDLDEISMKKNDALLDISSREALVLTISLLLNAL